MTRIEMCLWEVRQEFKGKAEKLELDAAGRSLFLREMGEKGENMMEEGEGQTLRLQIRKSHAWGSKRGEAWGPWGRKMCSRVQKLVTCPASHEAWQDRAVVLPLWSRAAASREDRGPAGKNLAAGNRPLAPARRWGNSSSSPALFSLPFYHPNLLLRKIPTTPLKCLAWLENSLFAKS